MLATEDFLRSALPLKWLSCIRSWLKAPIPALALPPTVLGFYLLVAMGPNGFLGHLIQLFGLGLLRFTFPGLVLASDLFHALCRAAHAKRI